jgi:hypothetical protein
MADGWSVPGAHIALAAPLNLIEDDSGNDNQEHATKRRAQQRATRTTILVEW